MLNPRHHHKPDLLLVLILLVVVGLTATITVQFKSETQIKTDMEQSMITSIDSAPSKG